MENGYLICTDLDRTLIPNGPEPEPAGARRLFAGLVARSQVILAYVSGRHEGLVREAISTYRLPVPQWVIGDVGTTIYQVAEDGEWARLESWERQIAADWGGCSASDLQELLQSVPGLSLQEHSKQNRLKVSFYVPLHADIDHLSHAVRERLESAGIRARLVWSVDDIADVGLLDVIPAQASKRHAVEALMEHLGMTAADTVFCGDSGNDLEVLISPIPAVLVANSRPDVKDLALEMAQEAGTLGQLYIAGGGLMGMNGNYSAGILEGLVHYHPRMADWLDARDSTRGRREA